MSFSVTISWPQTRDQAQRSKDHQLDFASGQTLEGSAAPEYQGSQDKVNPEESLLSALAACHMLSFLTIAQKKRLEVISYQDCASAELGRNSQGRTAITQITLNPKVIFNTEQSEETLAKLHALAHKHCFIANSLTKELMIKITPS
ncbi:OsmC family protein [Shewanella marisflavi]|uniref:OsmC family protein n=1 Tax=Shewanella marisflavi TaxID=260364 RepID=UPI0020102B27|nr:OsmC family protein [Shewanella marisflavi]MCL1040755.1 OsmC family protein [Shewanella marisflavi]